MENAAVTPPEKPTTRRIIKATKSRAPKTDTSLLTGDVQPSRVMWHGQLITSVRKTLGIYQTSDLKKWEPWPPSPETTKVIFDNLVKNLAQAPAPDEVMAVLTAPGFRVEILAEIIQRRMILDAQQDSPADTVVPYIKR